MPTASLDTLLAWMKEHEALLWWVGLGSAAVSVGTILAIPWIVSRIPDDYFATKERPPIGDRSEHPVLRWTLRILKNLFGGILFLLGLVMLVGPGQGLMAILAALLLMDFPGKRRFEMWIIRRPGLLKGINWLRTRRGRPPLVVWSPEPKGLPAPPREKEPARR